MSLINDALKKAQKQRTGEAPALGSLPSIGGEAPRQISRRGRSSGGNPALVGGGIVGAIALVAGLAWFALREKPASPASAAQAHALTAPTPPPVAAARPAEPPASPPPVFTLPTAPRSEPPAAAAVASAPAPAPAAPAPTPKPAAVEPAAPPRSLDPVAIQYLDNIKVAGIRASASDSKVLMNDRVYRIGSIVNGEMGLKLVGITANSLTFEDQQGGRYTRTF